MSSESAPRSSTNDALLSTWLSSTPSCSTIICFTFCSTAMLPPGICANPLILTGLAKHSQVTGKILESDPARPHLVAGYPHSATEWGWADLRRDRSGSETWLQTEPRQSG